MEILHLDGGTLRSLNPKLQPETRDPKLGDKLLYQESCMEARAFPCREWLRRHFATFWEKRASRSVKSWLQKVLGLGISPRGLDSAAGTYSWSSGLRHLTLSPAPGRIVRERRTERVGVYLRVTVFWDCRIEPWETSRSNSDFGLCKQQGARFGVSPGAIA